MNKGISRLGKRKRARVCALKAFKRIKDTPLPHAGRDASAITKHKK